jgi:hypothetical protein
MNTPWFNYFLSELRADNYKGVSCALRAGYDMDYIQGDVEDLVWHLLTGSPQILIELGKSSRVREIIFPWVYLKSPVLDSISSQRPKDLRTMCLLAEGNYHEDKHQPLFKHAWITSSPFFRFLYDIVEIPYLLMPLDTAISRWFELLQRGDSLFYYDYPESELDHLHFRIMGQIAWEESHPMMDEYSSSRSSYIFKDFGTLWSVLRSRIRNMDQAPQLRGANHAEEAYRILKENF